MTENEKLSTKVQKALNPTQLIKTKVTETDLKKLKNEEEIVLQHHKIKGVELKIRKDWRFEALFGSPVAFYGDSYIVTDNTDKAFPNHGVLYNQKEMVNYLKELLETENLSLYHYLRNLAKRELRPGDMIEFDDGKKGVITIPEGDTFPRNAVYIPMKKDGTLSKLKPRYIYANSNYQKVETEEE